MVRYITGAALLLAVSGALASPWPATTKHATHRYRDVSHNLRVSAYQPESRYETFGDGVDHPLSKRDTPVSTEEAALSFLESHLGVNASSLSYRTGYSGEVTKHAYIRQKINGIDVTNAVANVALNKNDKVIAYGSSFVKPKSIASSKPTISKTDAIAKAEATFSAKYNNWKIATEYFVRDDGHLSLTYIVQVQNDDHWWEVSVDAANGDIVNAVDFVAEASYKVIAFDKQDPTEGFTVETDPADKIASPGGWHVAGSNTYTTTRGNNVVAYKSSSIGTSSQTSSENNYIYTHDPALAPSAGPNVDVARVNAFYTGNMVHDLAYRYGFTEAAYNFQADNRGKGGLGNDAVNLSIQDSSGSNNANFATPADGQAGTCRMYTWTYNTPNRDGAIENDIVVHEFTHGITNRMTGGGTGRCLQTTEAGGMGEGWSDTLAFWTEQKSATINDFTLGSYVYNNVKGIRTVPYSTNETVDPLMYSKLKTLVEVHAVGEIWATVLIEVYTALVGKYGFSSNKFDPTGTAGNIVFLHLFIDALPIQPCNPTLVAARDAIIQADVNRYGGVNKCLIWTAFAKRGLGTGAGPSREDSTTVPTGC
ncbi:hypothetical protein BOTBODRAFT_131082 [Botryobasidium botryosum FD-172 SS1]|uniref:Extracellular metalloproteinase n=1 Tax=Botryobasidium botryosum (strain FD-172 SS1) TaxID=930990 RepID=A0A067MIK2_BOTB1|nr:hypothetical protein BOTBODRAFT_131082 [Botryobasidium botryosum FD-172 SS1]